MRNILYSILAFFWFFVAVFLGAILIFAALGNSTSIATLPEFLGVCLFINLGMIAIWLGWWLKKVVTGRRGFFFGLQRKSLFFSPIRADAKINKFGHQAVYLFGSLSIIVLLIYLNTVG